MTVGPPLLAVNRVDRVASRRRAARLCGHRQSDTLRVEPVQTRSAVVQGRSLPTHVCKARTPEEESCHGDRSAPLTWSRWVQARVREALGGLWRSLSRGRSVVAGKAQSDETDGDRALARGRFWTEFRAGQREAEAHGSRPR